MIRVENLNFNYGNKQVMSDLNLEIGEGMICGLLGRNGAGKSTLLYLMMGLLQAKSGQVMVDECKANERRAEMLQEIFLVPEEFDLPKMKLEKYIKSFKSFYPRFSDELLTKCLEGFGLTRDLELGSLSMGQKKQVYICIALASNTKYLLMDEPTNGLDIPSKSQFRKVVIMGMNDERTVVVSTHQVHDVEKLLDHLIVVDNSKVLYNAPLEEADGEPINLEEMFVKIVTNEK